MKSGLLFLCKCTYYLFGNNSYLRFRNVKQNDVAEIMCNKLLKWTCYFVTLLRNLNLLQHHCTLFVSQHIKQIFN